MTRMSVQRLQSSRYARFSCTFFGQITVSLYPCGSAVAAHARLHEEGGPGGGEPDDQGDQGAGDQEDEQAGQRGGHVERALQEALKEGHGIKPPWVRPRRTGSVGPRRPPLQLGPGLPTPLPMCPK